MSNHKSAYQLLKNGDPIALGNLDHCLDVFIGKFTMETITCNTK